MVTAVGYRPLPFEPDLPPQRVHQVGDCVRAGNLLDVIWGVYDLVTKL